MTLRFLPSDLVVPKGGSLRLTVAGVVTYQKTEGSSQPSGAASEITILHDCGQPSVLRFRMPKKNAQLLNVRETDEPKLKKTKAAKMGNMSGGGLASQRGCGKDRKSTRLNSSHANI